MASAGLVCLALEAFKRCLAIYLYSSYQKEYYFYIFFYMSFSLHNSLQLFIKSLSLRFYGLRVLPEAVLITLAAVDTRKVPQQL